MPREPVNSPRVGLNTNCILTLAVVPSCPTRCHSGASDKSVLWYVFFSSLQAVHLDVASDCKIPGDSTGRAVRVSFQESVRAACG